VKRAAILLSATALLLGACGPEPTDPKHQVGANPSLPPLHQYLLPPMKVASRGQWGNTKPAVAGGLHIEALAKNFANPRMVYVLPNNDVLVVESDGPKEPIRRPKQIVMNWIESQVHSANKAGNRIILLRDTNGDGMPDLRTVFIDHLVHPFGVVLVGSDLYVANTDTVMRFAYHEGETHISDPGTKLTDLPGGPIDHHWTKSLTASPDGSKLYVGVGSNSNITENGMEAEHERAAIWEIDRASGAHRLYATGTRNPAALAINPTTHVLWTAVNERDELGPDLVPDYLTSIKDGGFYGWPWSYWGQHVDPRVYPQRPDMVKKAIMPDYSLSSHVAPLGIAFAARSTLPNYHDGVFVGEHGSWDRAPFNGYKVVYVPFANGRPSGSPKDVVTGFLRGSNALGRPVGLAIDKRGGLLIADDLGGTVWRVSAR
jgi:glucose/arabinose dehydrogenase